MLFLFKSPKIKLPKSNHFNGETFHNLEKSDTKRKFINFLKWKFLSKPKRWPKWVNIKQQQVLSERTKQGEARITFINHATMLIQMDGVNILTDPMYSQRTSPFRFLGPKRVKQPGVKFDDLPPIDIILISHNHYDSFDIPTLDKLRQRDKPKIGFGIGNAYYLNTSFDQDVIEMDWQDAFDFKPLKFIFLPAQHWSKRGFNDTNKALWGSFAIIGSKKIYFAGDTGYANHFKTVKQQFDYFDLSLLPIGAYEPRWFMKGDHMNPDDAVQAHLDLNSKKSMGFHFGTFPLTNEAIDDPVKDLNKAKKQYHISEDDFCTLKEGESFCI